MGAPVSADDLDSLISGLAHRGLDGTGSWRQGAIGLGQQITRLTPESLDENLPCFQAEANLALVADAFLHNREDLCRTLNLSHSEGRQLADSQLILKSYQKWGERCPEYLLGDFAFAIWDGGIQQLFCCRSHSRGRPFFYHYDGRRFVFASEIKGILAVPGVPRRLNEAHLARVGIAGAQLVSNEATFYQHISILPSALSLVVNRHGLRLRRYWQLNPEAELPFKSHEEILEAFEDLMFDVIGESVRSAFPVTAQLSGGLDSSSIVGVAAKCLERQGKQLTVMSAVKANPDDHEIADERFYIDQFRSWPNIAIKYITAPQRGPFDDIEKVVRGYDSPMATPCHYLYSAFMEASRECGARVMLTGDFGELGPTFSGNGFYSELLLHWRWRTLAHELRQRSRISGRSRGLILISEVLRPLPPMDWLLRWLRRKNDGRQDHGVLRPDYVRRQLGERAREFEQASRTAARKWPDQRRNHYNLIHCWHQKNAGAEGFPGYEQVRSSSPFSDKRLLEFCLAVPGDLKVRDGYPRYLVRAGLRNILPPEIRWRTSKLPFSPDYRRRYNAQRRQAQDILAAITPTDPVRQIVDVDGLRSLAAQGMMIQRSRTAGLEPGLIIVPFGIYLIYFLRQFPEFQT
ncbi:MAG TPA: asparagine synthase-related protein [Blastocatellia bacterium]|nr:asparagine synthase-related protein [Blastocatellia bacterium]